MAVTTLRDPEDVRARLAEMRPESGRIPGFVFSDPDVYRLEMDAIFNHCWLFVGHQSEIPSPGDYVTRYMGEHPVIVTRDEHGHVRVLLNVCRHRGMRLCRADLGNASHFRCPYHGFTYKNNGELIGIPFQQEIYGTDLDKSKFGLIRARVESYHGLIFATFSDRAEPLRDYLGAMTWYLDILAGRADMEVVGPPLRHEMATNWKLPAENFASDAYHTLHTHASAAEIGLTPSAKWAKDGYHVSAGNGHAVMLGTPAARFIFASELLPVFEQRLRPEQFALLRTLANMPGTVFPNLSFLISAITFKNRVISHTEVFLWRPIGPDRIEEIVWFLVEKDAPQEWKDLSRQAFVLTFGPSGIFSQDDTENFTLIARGSRTPLVRGLSFLYEMGRTAVPITTFAGPGTVYEGKYSEANARAYHRRWLDLMMAGA
jgi:phenylpropionate dioxygenase-like ring-hydroxylating dioxygenase large terminal subunit